MDLNAIKSEQTYIADVLEIRKPYMADWEKIDRRMNAFERIGYYVEHLRFRATNARNAIMRF